MHDAGIPHGGGSYMNRTVILHSGGTYIYKEINRDKIFVNVP